MPIHAQSPGFKGLSMVQYSNAIVCNMMDTAVIFLCLKFQTHMSNVIKIMNTSEMMGVTGLGDDKICFYLNLLFYHRSPV